ncbi:MAG TPA: DNA polymerase I [Chloroflexota bacterium]|nr:DNA polymerase I [Chloroflexota bacterium]
MSESEGAGRGPAVAPSGRLLLLDGNALVHRGFHALQQPLTSPRGELVNAVYGVAMMLLKALADLKPQYLTAAFDTAAPTFRHEAYADYKGTRGPAAEGLHDQFDRVYELLEAFGAGIYRLDGYEADDLLGALSQQAVAQGLEVVILTGDLDALQLVGPHVRVLTSRRGLSDTVMYDEAAVRERFGFAPPQLVDYKALRGDTSDNIPGVPGIGDKTASRLVAEYGDVANLYAHLDDLPEKQRKLLAPYADQVREARRLAQIVSDLPVQLDLAGSALSRYDRGKALALFHELGFRSLIDRLPPSPPAPLPGGEGSGPPAPSVAVSGGEGRGAARQASLFGEEGGVPSPPAPLSEGEGSGARSPAEGEGSAPRSPSANGRARDGYHGEGQDTPLPMGEGPGVRAPEGLVTTTEALDALAAELRASQGFAFGVQTTGVDAMRADLVGLAFATSPERAWYVPLGHVGEDAPPQLAVEPTLAALRPVLADETLPKHAHNAKFGLVVLARHGVAVEGLSFDTMLAAYLLESSQRAQTLRDLAWAKLDQADVPAAKTILGEGKRARTMAEVPVAEAAEYARLQVTLIERLVPVLLRDLDAAALRALYFDLELPLVPVLAVMERHGVMVDVPFLQRLSTELYGAIQTLEQEIYDLAGGPFNINSPPQLSDVLFGKLGLKPPPGKRTKTGHISTNVQVLAELRDSHPIINLILRARQLLKLKGTYVDALPLLVNPETGRVHTSFNQTLAATGRISSSDPNLQNIPIRTELGRRVRQAFVAPPGCVLLGADYSQIELRILAHVTGEPALVEAFRHHEDIHAATAERILGVPLEDVTPDQRRIAKTVNFGVLYRISDYGLASRLGMTTAEAGAFIREYFARFSTVRAYQERVLEEGRRCGYVMTLQGRRRYLPELTARHGGVRQAAERMAVNAPIQGTAADIIKQAMIDIQRYLDEHHLRAKMLLQVHDELVFEVPDDEVATLAPVVKRLMEGAYPLAVPLEVEIKTGRHWGEMTPAREGEELAVEVEE